jgi:6,7-dimethyl-8-ribityllumazine synthase
MWVPCSWPQTLVEEIAVDATTTTKDALVGGAAPVRLTVEYLVDTGVTDAVVTLTIVTDGTTTTWTDTSSAVGYHVNDQLAAVKPGSKLTLTVTDALARVRWCETICC